MAALTKDRDTKMLLAPETRLLRVAAATKLFAGALVARNAAGFLVPGATALGLTALGRAQALADNTAGANGDVVAEVRTGTFRFANSAAADEITDADIGATAYIVDDQTVAKTDATGTRSAAGKIWSVDSQGVWVTFT